MGGTDKKCEYRDEIIKMLHEIDYENMLEYIYIIIEEMHKKIKRSE